MCRFPGIQDIRYFFDTGYAVCDTFRTLLLLDGIDLTNQMNDVRFGNHVDVVVGSQVTFRKKVFDFRGQNAESRASAWKARTQRAIKRVEVICWTFIVLPLLRRRRCHLFANFG